MHEHIARGIGRRRFLGAIAALAPAIGASRVLAQPVPPADAMAHWNRADEIPLWNGEAPNGGFRAPGSPGGSMPIFQNIERPYLKVFRPEVSNGRSLLSIPGGAYTAVSFVNEGVDIAKVMNPRGYTVFVLIYRLPGEGWAGREDVPLQDAQRAVRLIRARSAEYRCDPDQIYALGFSAGGHLAASLETGFAERIYEPRDKTDTLSARPRAVGLIYPVISHTAGIGHALSTLRLLGENPTTTNIVRRSPDLHVSEETPPTFLVHSIDDRAVSLENSLLMLGALRAARRPVEAHFFEKGGHGFGIGQPGQPCATWPDLFATWMDSHAA